MMAKSKAKKSDKNLFELIDEELEKAGFKPTPAREQCGAHQVHTDNQAETLSATTDEVRGNESDGTN